MVEEKKKKKHVFKLLTRQGRKSDDALCETFKDGEFNAWGSLERNEK